MRLTTSLASGWPGTIGFPLSCSSSASSRRSSRRSASRDALSGPWHLKHLFEGIGRTSRLISTFAGAAFASAVAETTVATTQAFLAA
jgi:hypothetical protein